VKVTPENKGARGREKKKGARRQNTGDQNVCYDMDDFAYNLEVPPPTEITTPVLQHAHAILVLVTTPPANCEFFVIQRVYIRVFAAVLLNVI